MNKPGSDDMSSVTSADSADNFAARSSLYQEFLAERDEILRHKWIESEKAGRISDLNVLYSTGYANTWKNWRNARGSNKTNHTRTDRLVESGSGNRDTRSCGLEITLA